MLRNRFAPLACLVLYGLGGCANDVGMPTPGSEQTVGGADAGGLVGDDCYLDEDCRSGVCWDYSEVDPACIGRMCSMPCNDNVQCVEAARAIRERRAGERLVADVDRSHYAACREVCDFSFVFVNFACQ